MREGFTTGTCAAGAAKGSAIFLRFGQIVSSVSVKNLEGREFVLNVSHENENFFSVAKDSGDDKSDVTNGIKIFARVEFLEGQDEIFFEGGEGVGVVTLPGLKIPVGEPAINPVPRKMIELAVREIFPRNSIKVTVKIPGGEKIAAKTFNPRLGIKGGLSILGTSGVVRPMSEKALLDSLSLELNMIKALDFRELFITFGNTSEKFLRKIFALETRNVIQAGNYIGCVLDEAAKADFIRATVFGYTGKLLKVAAGSFNTHNKISDGRLEALCTHLALAGADRGLVERVFHSNTTTEAIKIIRENNFDFVWNNIAERISLKCRERTFAKMKIDVFIIDDDGKILGSFHS
ncbi:MAG: cobalamin biosynthesis protein CbiD [Synergistaceae bacterium]|nr:cobalamin biosynthesis protein CbiD [Synergistaceae bacterium]